MNDASTPTQEPVFAFLSDPSLHPSVRRIDTHAASVFLEGARALKIKRAVRFPFLDYSTLERRKAACEDEIRINRPFAPDIYHRVVAITQDERGVLAIDGKGTPVEYAVEMARFDESLTFDHLAEAGELPPDLVDAMADAIAASHAVAAAADSAGWITSLPNLLDGNRRGLLDRQNFGGAEVAEFDRASRALLAVASSKLVARGERGFVRRCHGDLHLANIVLIAGKPVLFDAIEFDERIATIDVLYDLAFPLMDLLHYGRREAATALLNRYLARTSPENFEGIGALQLFMSMRAAIRAQVLMARLHRPGTRADAIGAAARGYFDLARELVHPTAARIVAVGGMSGTGKSVLARALAPVLYPLPGAVILRSDVMRKQMFGVGETDRLPAEAYRPEVSDRIYRELEQRSRDIVAQGHSVIVDAVFARESERTGIRGVATRAGLKFHGIFLTADLPIRVARVTGRRADASDATAEVAIRQENYNLGPIDWSVIDASGSTASTTAQCRAELEREV